MAYIPIALRQEIAKRARHRCEYCLSLEFITGGPMHVEHIRPEFEGGTSELVNLAYACARCNLHKAIRTHHIDPVSERKAPLFNPRKQKWLRHFEWSTDGTRVIGRTRTGRATIVALQMNHPTIVMARNLWVSFGSHPPNI